jgi:hypothetical protein
MTTHDRSILHNPIGYLVSGAIRKVLFNKPISLDVLVVDATNSLKRFKRKDDHFFCNAASITIWRQRKALFGILIFSLPTPTDRSN